MESETYVRRRHWTLAEKRSVVEEAGTSGNVAATAKAIETPRSNLYKKLEAYEINREKDGK